MTAPGGTLLIRRIAPADEAQWRTAFAAFWHHFDRTLDADIYDLTWRRLHEPQERMYALGAFEAEQLVGLAHVVAHRSYSAEGLDHYLQHLFVASEARRRGIGRALIERLYKLVQEGGGHRVYWNTPSDNASAIHLYDEVAKDSGYRLYRKEFLRSR
jgi:ribosomal protein S18 acetylase RimI-like enzyme